MPHKSREAIDEQQSKTMNANELAKCKICGKKPNYTRIEPDCSMHSGYVEIRCCFSVYLDPRDIDLDYPTVGMSGWDIIYAKLNECEREAKRRWNLINS